jgi:hypothetical protein
MIHVDRPQTMQLDIFEHSRDVMLRNDLVEALVRRDATAARSARQALADAYPQDTALADASVLIEILDQVDDRPWLTHAPANAARAHVEQHVVPAANGLLGETRRGMAGWAVGRTRATSYRAAVSNRRADAQPGCTYAPAGGECRDAAECVESWRHPGTLVLGGARALAPDGLMLSGHCWPSWPGCRVPSEHALPERSVSGRSCCAVSAWISMAAAGPMT